MATLAIIVAVVFWRVLKRIAWDVHHTKATSSKAMWESATANHRIDGILRHLLPEEMDALGALLRAGDHRAADSAKIENPAKDFQEMAHLYDPAKD